jgi:hypothetical protein
MEKLRISRLTLIAVDNAQHLLTHFNETSAGLYGTGVLPFEKTAIEIEIVSMSYPSRPR